MSKSKPPAWERPHPNQLTRRQLLSFVARLQQLLYMDYDAAGRPFLNPEKSWNGADICDQIPSLLRRYDLAPLEPQPWQLIR